MVEVDQLAAIARVRAETEPEVCRVWLFGSRVWGRMPRLGQDKGWRAGSPG